MQILIVVVIYKTALKQSETLDGLCRAFDKYPELLQSIGLLIWDNSPVSVEDPAFPFPFEYRHTSDNLGVSGAYNRAMEFAESTGCPWLLLFDQDTTVPDTFLRRMLEYSREQERDTNIAAVAPFLLDGDQEISPVIPLFYRFKLMSRPFRGVYPDEVFVANSGTLMRVSSLREIGGYDERFWLDYSDIVAFHQLHRNGRRIYVAGDLELQHKIACVDYDGTMSAERYLNSIAAEGAYWDMYRTRLQSAMQTVRLLARTLRQYRHYKNKTFSKITWKYFCVRLFVSKTERLKRWKQQSLQRNIPAISKVIVND
jgi:GT2 family glycosyltransferase